MENDEQGTAESQTRRQLRGGGAEGRQAGKHSGFQNNPGFEMLERLDSGPFLKLGRERRGGGGEHRPTWSYQPKEEERA